jgi:hypothetical protein
MNSEASDRLQSVPHEFRSQLAELWENIDPNAFQDPEFDWDEEARRVSDMGLEGKLGPVIQQALERRYSACVRIMGQTPTSLPPEDFLRFQAGSLRCVRRLRMLELGGLSRKEHRAMWEQHQNRAATEVARGFDRYASD